MNTLTELHNINEQIVNESIKPFDAYLKLMEINKLSAELIEAIKEPAVEQLKQEGGKFENDKFIVSVVNSAGQWNFKHIKEWNDLKEKLKEVEEGAKEAFKAYEKGRDIVQEGVVIESAHFRAGAETFVVKKKI